MNIFVLDSNPKYAAEMHNNKHVVKMILETAQILSTSLRMNGIDAPYKSTHQKHPCVIWANSSRDNFRWLCKLGIYLCAEYRFRYGREHAAQEVIEFAAQNIPKFSKIKLTPFAQAMPEEYKNQDAVIAYRNYYIGEKLKFSKWTKRAIPEWIPQEINK